MYTQNHSLSDGIDPSVAVTNLMISKILFKTTVKFSLIFFNFFFTSSCSYVVTGKFFKCCIASFYFHTASRDQWGHVFRIGEGENVVGRAIP